MHEWALADAVVSTAAKVAEKEKLSEITEIKIGLGQLQQIETNIFEFAIREIIRSQKTVFKKTKIVLQVQKAVMKCRNCGKKWASAAVVERLDSTDSEAIHFVPEVAHAYIRCPECKSPDFEIAQGRGVWINSISGEKVR